MSQRGRILDTLLEVVYPSKGVCAFCGGEVHVDPRLAVCAACFEKLQALRSLPPIGMVEGVLWVAPYRYQLLARDTVKRFKYNAGRWMAPYLAAHITDTLRETRTEADLVTYVPMHRKKQAQRGYNQAQALAQGVADILRLPLADALVKVRETETQTHLSAAARRENIRGAFEAAGRFEGHRILLVDDVITTGATAAACARLLKRAGAKDVVIAALIRNRNEG